MRSLCDQFCDRYMVYDCSSKSCYIMLPSLRDSYLKSSIDLLLSKTAKKERLTTFKDTPAYKCRQKFESFIRNRKDSATGLYGALELVFAEMAIKEFFKEPNVWLLNHNARAKQYRATEENRRNYILKHAPKDQLEVSRDCMIATANSSVSAAARARREMQRN